MKDKTTSLRVTQQLVSALLLSSLLSQEGWELRLHRDRYYRFHKLNNPKPHKISAQDPISYYALELGKRLVELITDMKNINFTIRKIDDLKSNPNLPRYLKIKTKPKKSKKN